MSPLTFHYSQRQKHAGRRLRGRARGFTLLELMAVVLIVSILAVIAVPGIAHRMQEYKSQEAANQIATLYRSARMRAMARGSAVTVRWNAGTQTFDTIESLEPSPGCGSRVGTACKNPTAVQLINRFGVASTGDNQASVTGPAAEAGLAAMDVCFTSLGTARYRASNDPTTDVLPMTGIAQVSVSRPSTLGLTRTVLLLPNGTARVIVASPLTP